MIDDFHGPIEWDAFAREMKRLFPDREIVEIPKDHPVFNCFYKIDGYPQVAGPRLVPAGPHLGDAAASCRTCARFSTTTAAR